VENELDKHLTIKKMACAGAVIVPVLVELGYLIYKYFKRRIKEDQIAEEIVDEGTRSKARSHRR
jgi:hypothetical protein